MRKILYTKQTDLRDCGVACLISMVKYYGGYASREYLRELTKTSNEGVSVYSLVEAADKLGFEAKAVKGSLNNLLKESTPFIAHLLINKQYGHFVIVTKIDDKEITVMDPDGGFRTYGYNAWNNLSSNVYILMQPRTEILKQAKEKSIWKLMFPIINNYKLTFLLLFIFSLIYTASNILISYQFQFFLDLLTKDNIDALTYIFIFLIIVIFLKESTNLFRNNLVNYVNHKLDDSLIKEVYNHIIRLPYLYFKNRTKGDIITRIQDVFKIRDVISKLLVTLSIDLVLLVVIFIVLIKINIKLSLVTLVITILYIFIILFYNSLIGNKIKTMKEREVEVNNHLIESLSSINTVKGMQIEESLRDKLSYKFSNYQDASFNLYHHFYIEDFFKELLYGIGLLIIIYLGIKEVDMGNLTLGKLLVFNSLLTYYFTPISNICSLQILIKEASVSFVRIKELLNVEVENLTLDDKVLNEHLKGQILIQDLKYSYNGMNDAIKCPHLEINSGEKVLLYGTSGGGKSTLMKLLTRYLDNYEGDILIDNRKIYSYNLKDIRRKITYVSQDETLFTDTIYNNITLGTNATYDDYLKVTKLLGIDKIIERSLLKDNMLLENNGGNLSGGERQRIILARALLKKSDIYIFDESLSALDIKAERRILENIFEVLKNRTVIVISHRFNNKDLYQRFILVQKGLIYEY